MLRTGDTVRLKEGTSNAKGVVVRDRSFDGIALWSLPKKSRWIQWEDEPEGELEWAMERELEVVKRYVKPKTERCGLSAWTTGDKMYVKRMYKTKTYQYMADKLHKTKNQIEYYVKHNGWTKYKNGNLA